MTKCTCTISQMENWGLCSFCERIATLEYRIERQKQILKDARKANCPQYFIQDVKNVLRSFEIELAALERKGVAA